MNPYGATTPQKRPDPRFTGSKAANCREFKGFGVGMTSFKSNRKLRRIALTATVGMAVLIGCAGTFARAADDDDDVLLDTKIFRGIMKGLGLRKDGEGIDYRERSPLGRNIGNGLASRVPRGFALKFNRLEKAPAAACRHGNA